MQKFSLALRRRLVTAAWAVLVLCLVPAALHATDYTVNVLTDAKPTAGGAGNGTTGDLRYCITQANSGAVGSTHRVSFAVAGTITLAGHELVINSNLAINGPGEVNLTVDGNRASRIFYVAPLHTVAISGLTLVRGNGASNDATGLDVGGGTYENNGGAILNNQSALTLTNCTLQANANANSLASEKFFGGGAITNLAQGVGATLILNRCTLTGNSVQGGPGGALTSYTTRTVATVNINDSTLSNNTAEYAGGALFNLGSYGAAANVAISNSTISGNREARYGGGGIYNNTNAAMTITNSVISGNASTGTNSAGGGGLVNIGDNAAMTLLGCTVQANTSSASGGGISNYRTVEDGKNLTLTIRNSTVSGNTAGLDGGGIYNFGGFGQTSATVVDSTLSGNSAQNGGGIENYARGASASVVVANATICANTARQRGGGVYNYSDGGTATAAVANSTVGGNSALGGGAGIANDKTADASVVATLTLSNSLLALNSTGANFATANGAIGSGGYNLSDDASGAVFLTAAGDLNSALAGLQVDGANKPLLQDNGGPTLTVALLPGSRAIDAGKAAVDPVTGGAATTDQRGFQRPFDVASIANAAGGDGSDIGAFESNSVPVPAPVIAVNPATVAGQVGAAFSYQIVAANSPTSYGAGSLPAGLSVDPVTGLISGTPLASGSAAVTLSATNATGTGTATLTLTIAAASASAPVINSGALPDAQQGLPYVGYQITATNGPTSFDATGLPAGLSVDTVKGTIGGTPTESGVFQVTISATNASGTGAATLTLNVAVKNSLPTITLTAAVSSITAGAGEIGLFQLNRDDANPDTQLMVNYKIAGSAVGGADYLALKGVKKMKAGKSSVKIKITPLGNGAGPGVKRVVTLILLPGEGYNVGTTSKVKVKIFGQ